MSRLASRVLSWWVWTTTSLFTHSFLPFPLYQWGHKSSRKDRDFGLWVLAENSVWEKMGMWQWDCLSPSLGSVAEFILCPEVQVHSQFWRSRLDKIDSLCCNTGGNCLSLKTLGKRFTAVKDFWCCCCCCFKGLDYIVVAFRFLFLIQYCQFSAILFHALDSPDQINKWSSQHISCGIISLMNLWIRDNCYVPMF